MKAKMIVSVLALLFVSFIGNAQNDLQPEPSSFSMGISANKAARHFDLAISNPENKKLHLQISNTNLGVVIDTVITGQAFIQRYNMEQVEDGEYTVVLRSGKEKQVKKIELKTVMTRNLEVIK